MVYNIHYLAPSFSAVVTGLQFAKSVSHKTLFTNIYIF